MSENQKEQDLKEKKENSEQEDNQPKKERQLYNKFKKDLDLSNFVVKNAINSINSWVIGVENHRNYKMKQEFDKEKEFKLSEQNEIKNQIEELSNDRGNEQVIQYFNDKINQQKELYNKYTEKRVKMHNEQLRKYNKENLKLMDQISKLESEIDYQSSILENNYLLNYNDNNIDLSQNNNYSTSNIENNFNNNIQKNFINNKSVSSIKINEIIEENETIRNQYNLLSQLKKDYKKRKAENLNLLKNIAEMNTECFSYKKMFNEGMHEIAKELLKLHELQLDKVINNNGENNSNINSIYFEMVKSSGNGKKNDETFKLPIINSNIMKKYNFPISEKRTPETSTFNVIKKMMEESHNLNKIINMKKNKFSWEEFKTFSAYQIYTILNLNKDVVKKLENHIFPNKPVIPENFD